MNWSVKTVNQIELKWSPYWFLILVNSGFWNINLAANLLFTSCSRILKCLIVDSPMWSTVQNISQSRKRYFPHVSWSCPWEKYSKPLYVFCLPLSTENTSTRPLVRSSLQDRRILCSTLIQAAMLPSAIIGQRGTLPVTPLGYLNSKKVIFRTMRAMRKQFPVVPRTTHWCVDGKMPANLIWKHGVAKKIEEWWQW